MIKIEYIKKEMVTRIYHVGSDYIRLRVALLDRIQEHENEYVVVLYVGSLPTRLAFKKDGAKHPTKAELMKLITKNGKEILRMMF